MPAMCVHDLKSHCVAKYFNEWSDIKETTIQESWAKSIVFSFEFNILLRQPAQQLQSSLPFAVCRQL